MAAFFASLPSWLQAAAMAQSPARVVNPVPLYPGGSEGAGVLRGLVVGRRCRPHWGPGLGVWWEVSPLMFWGLVPPGLAPGLGVGSVMVWRCRLLLCGWSVARASCRGSWASRWPS